MSDIPTTLEYTKDHEWVATTGKGGARVGITHYAQRQLGDIVFVELPEEGRKFTAGEAFGTVESVKSVSELYAPLTGSIAAVNAELAEDPELINQDPYGDGWLVEITATTEPDGLLTAAEYGAYVSEGE
ncbi:glycine cleavage system protein GcvH [Kitasatospora sp. NPDC059577]|uniref:glycine cleavage system protein GcvH n=1 Tax=Kitasatospora sp. NPDC059577 TaxID=3346873 RepID=UPI0036A94643